MAERTGSLCSVPFQPGLDLETTGKSAAVACLEAAIAAHGVPRKVLADEVGMSEGHFSKVANGRQGDLLDLAYALPAALRADFFARLAESERLDPEAVAAVQLLYAAARFLRLARVPTRAIDAAVGRLNQEREA